MLQHCAFAAASTLLCFSLRSLRRFSLSCLPCSSPFASPLCFSLLRLSCSSCSCVSLMFLCLVLLSPGISFPASFSVSYRRTHVCFCALSCCRRLCRVRLLFLWTFFLVVFLLFRLVSMLSLRPDLRCFALLFSSAGSRAMVSHMRLYIVNMGR